MRGLDGVISGGYRNITGMVVMQNGAILYENYFGGHTAGDCAHVYSVTKSVVSALIGIAIDRGLIEGVSRRVLDFFPGYTPKRGEKTMQLVTLRDILTMTAPYKYRSSPYTKYFTSESWVKASLDLLGGKGRIGAFRYAPIAGPDILTGIIAAASGRSTLDFANECLFEPLGISPRRSRAFESKEDQLAWYKSKKYSRDWVCDPQGVNTAGWGLTLTPLEMARIGQLYLNGGVWGEKRILPEPWVKESTAEHSRWDEQGLEYGYLWWIIDGARRIYAALGDGGNAIYVNESKGLVVSIASAFDPRAKDSVELIREHIEPLL